MDPEFMESKVKLLKSIIDSSEIPEIDIKKALLKCDNDANAALNLLLDSPTPHLTAVQRTVTPTGGSRISTTCQSERKKLVVEKHEGFVKGIDNVAKEETIEDCKDQSVFLSSGDLKENRRSRFREWMKSEENEDSTVINETKEEAIANEVNSTTTSTVTVKEEVEELSIHEQWLRSQEYKQQATRVKEEPKEVTAATSVITIKEEMEELMDVQPLRSRKLSDDEYRSLQMRNSYQKPKKEMSLSTVVIEDGEFPEERDWLLVGRTVITGTSTTKGRKLENNEIVHFAFPQYDKIRQSVSAKVARALSNIVRFSTKRSGEIGRLPMEWASCLVPLVNSSKVKVCARCVSAPVNLQLMQNIMLYASFYIHSSVFISSDASSLKFQPAIIDPTTYPLLNLFRLLKITPSQKAEFSPDEFDSRKRSLKIDDDPEDVETVVPLVKRRKGCELPDQNKDEQSISQESLNKLVGAADFYNLEEMEPPATLTCVLKPYQKQALYWMSKLESGTNVEESGSTLHPCWAAYRVCDQRAPAIYVNIFSGEATREFPSTTQTARGGILADAMGLGKTVMTIALILARRGRGSPVARQEEGMSESLRTRQRVPTTDASGKVKGGTLIICPMALLSQWKDELDTHSEPDSLSIFVHYGGDRTTDPRSIATSDVVLTTYGTLTSAWKHGIENSIFHKVEWHRVVLDEAHIIKSSKTHTAQAAFALSSYCRWCITGTPLQNKLEDLFSLLCFLHVEPWCNWEWWNRLIQRPYENGDLRGLKLVKGILRSLMLRRTKESKDKEGRPILVLPPTDIKTIECEKSALEHEFYDALFTRSKVQFDQLVAEGKVLHNYANILELLLRLRQCCNHPLLVMRRASTEKYADLNELANKFLQNNADSSQTGPSPVYVEEVVKNLQNGENAECPICFELPDDPVLTPCAHRMCKECLLFSWNTPDSGVCPLCRQVIKKTDLIGCPSGGKTRIDVENNWKESSKISKLVECLERVRCSGEKSIVFSQWTSFLDILEIALKKRNIGFLRYDGKVVQKDRERILHEFGETKEKTVLLISLKAGGVGLNLTAASNVFLMDPWWNPAVEEQAIMRVHRIGQKRTVRVRRFIVKDTVEERLQEVQAKKQRMIAGALTGEEVRSTRLDELKMLFK